MAQVVLANAHEVLAVNKASHFLRVDPAPQALQEELRHREVTMRRRQMKHRVSFLNI